MGRLEQDLFTKALGHAPQHAEHHAWPAIPWHRLPEAHQHVAAHVEQQGSAYWQLHADAFRARVAE